MTCMEKYQEYMRKRAEELICLELEDIIDREFITYEEFKERFYEWNKE